MSKGWQGADIWLPRRRPTLVKLLISISIVIGALLIIVMWDTAPLPIIILFLVLIPLTFLLCLGMMWVIGQVWFGPQRLITDLPLEKAVAQVEGVLDRHGLEWRRYNHAEYRMEGRNEHMLNVLRNMEEEVEGYLIDVEDHLFSLWKNGRTYVRLYTKGRVPHKVMDDIEKALC